MKLLDFAIIKLVFCLILGILIGHLFPIGLKTALSFLGFSLIIFGIVFFVLRNSYKYSYWFGICAFWCMILIGIFKTSIQDDKQYKNHFTYNIALTDSASNTIIFRIREILKSSNYNDKYIIDVLEINSKIVSGKSLINVKKDSTTKQLKVDDIYIAKTHFEEIHSPLNPYQFNYKNYLKKQNIYLQLYTSNDELLQISKNKHTIYGYAAKLREHIQSKLKQYSFSSDEYAIISALLLGQRKDISMEVYESYSEAGAIHILALSGLHIGIILLLLNQLLKPLEYFKRGRQTKTIIIIALLWCFAIVAGLSASVTRAVTMFSIIAIAMHYKRQTNIYNTLSISAFVLLLINPNFLFDVGFQMSYLAVLAIVSIQPLIYKLYEPKNKIVDFFWNIFTVTLAAQFGVVPISLYYFHQFPGLFWLSNLVIIPFLGIILGLGIVVITLASINILPKFFAEFYASIISGMNSFVQWISNQETFLLQNISFSINQVILSYLLIVTILATLIQKSFKSLRLLLFIIIIGQIYFIYQLKTNTNQEFLIFHKSRYSILGFKVNDTLQIHHNLNDSILNIDKTITNYQVGSNIKTTRFDSIKNIYQVDNKILLVIDSLSIYKSLTFRPNFILLRNSPKINLNRLIDSLQPELIISDGSNYTSYQNRWKATCEAKKIPFHKTSEKGAFIIEY
ncbi:MAG: ComEC/Rec2 family competence protein [Flavobacteriaceae bacterium]